ncbi:putative NAD(P)H quinone oxidoreductase, PIG3 family [Gracilibacillus ureilyticus]|uniref:Putative NAD(P)H quinone oxidoreductase, PIG3 family n=1 Tax=Gracilibacillus ureilyticus TaxID=531814 RepID=A0A1H9R566_9BACI|nr:NAD(P)H-quinone oxidoreductase [Gracilibacillus ureilyticus]SER67884.1 putative NAD(P)H quinone oxidoreductase, PIG3 family [Gracilibacillus ureilyticus]
MKGIIAKEPGGRDQLVYVDVPDPVVNPGDILIEVHAAAVNRTDILNREGKLGYVKNPVIGIEVAGIVVDANGHGGFSHGDRVMGLVNGGAYAEYVTMPANRAMKIPENLDFNAAAAIPEVFLTAYQTLYWIAKLSKQESVLIHAGGSGVGTAAIQLAKGLSDAFVITTAGADNKLAKCKDLGADVLVNYKEKDFAQEVENATEGSGVSVILDFVGAQYWKQNYQSIAIDGRWVLIGVLGGSTVEKVKLMDLMMKRIQLTGTLLTPRSDQYKAELTREFSDETYELFEKGELKPVIDTIYAIEEVQKAHEMMEKNKNTGKIILKVKS